MIKFTNEIALITAVSDLRMFLDNVKGFTALFCRINSRSAAEKSPSGPINIQKDLNFLKSSVFKFSFELISANKIFTFPFADAETKVLLILSKLIFLIFEIQVHRIF